MQYVSAIVQIIVINLVLSGDNAVVIGMAAHRLAPAQRTKAIWFGGIAAIVLRIGLTVGAELLLQIPALKLIGGVVLIWIAFSLLKEEEECQDNVKEAATMREAILTILVADIIMSLENIIGVAAASGDSLTLLIFGLTVSMAIVLFMGSLIATLINRFWWLVYFGSGAIAWTAISLMFDDSLAKNYTAGISAPTERLVCVIVTAGTLAFAHWFHRVRGES
jgi:YjbE family integral membrane protein